MLGGYTSAVNLNRDEIEAILKGLKIEELRTDLALAPPHDTIREKLVRAKEVIQLRNEADRLEAL